MWSPCTFVRHLLLLLRLPAGQTPEITLLEITLLASPHREQVAEGVKLALSELRCVRGRVTVCVRVYVRVNNVHAGSR